MTTMIQKQADLVASDKPDHFRFYLQRTVTKAAIFVAHDGRAALLDNSYSLASAERWANGPEVNPAPYVPFECCRACQDNWERAQIRSRQLARIFVWGHLTEE